MASRPTVFSVGSILIGLGVIFVLLALGLAFTIYGQISAVLGVVCVASGIVMILRKHASRHS